MIFERLGRRRVAEQNRRIALETADRATFIECLPAIDLRLLRDGRGAVGRIVRMSAVPMTACVAMMVVVRMTVSTQMHVRPRIMLSDVASVHVRNRRQLT